MIPTKKINKVEMKNENKDFFQKLKRSNSLQKSYGLRLDGALRRSQRTYAA